MSNHTKTAKTSKISEYLDVLNEEIFNFSDSSVLESVLKNQIAKLITDKKKKSRILVYSDVWTRGGLERVMSIVMNHLVDSYEIILVSTDKKFETQFALDARIEHIKISQYNEVNIAVRLAKIAELLDVDLFIGNPNNYSNFLDVYRKLSELGIKSIACNHGSYFLPYWSAWMTPVIEKRLDAYKYASAVTWLTSFSTSIYKRLADNAAYMPNPNSYGNLEKQSLSEKAGKIILCVGRFYDSVKRIDRIFSVFREVLKKHPDAKLVLVGPYHADTVITDVLDVPIGEYLKSLDISVESIVFEGEQENLSKYYKEASVFMMTSSNEGFGMVLVEAGTFGLPCVIFEIPGLEDVVSDEVSGYIVEQDDISGMALKIATLLDDDELRVNMGMEAQKLVSRFDQDKICQRWENLIDLILNNDQHEINKKLAEKFMPEKKESPDFAERVIREYEKNIAWMLETNRKREIAKRAEKIKELENELQLVTSSKFWKVRGLYLKWKPIIFTPHKILLKYIKMMAYLLKSFMSSVMHEGLVSSLIRIWNYALHGKGVLDPNKINKEEEYASLKEVLNKFIKL